MEMHFALPDKVFIFLPFFFEIPAASEMRSISEKWDEGFDVIYRHDIFVISRK